MFHLTVTAAHSSILLFLDRKPWSRSTDRPFIGLYIFKAEGINNSKKEKKCVLPAETNFFSAHETQSLQKANLVSKSDKFSDAKEGFFFFFPCPPT